MTPSKLAKRTDVDRQVGILHDRYWTEALDTAYRKEIILVEGEDDRLAIDGILSRRSTTWPTKINIIAAGSRVASRPAPVARRRPRTVFSFQFLDRSYRPFRVR